MKIDEYQAKKILKSYGVPVPKGGVASTPQSPRLNTFRWHDKPGQGP